MPWQIYRRRKRKSHNCHRSMRHRWIQWAAPLTWRNTATAFSNCTDTCREEILYILVGLSNQSDGFREGNSGNSRFLPIYPENTGKWIFMTPFLYSRREIWNYERLLGQPFHIVIDVGLSQNRHHKHWKDNLCARYHFVGHFFHFEVHFIVNCSSYNLQP